MQQLFERYDKNRSGAIEVEELRGLLADMGLLTNKSLVEVDSFVVQQFVAADADKDSKLSFDEFTAYYAKVCIHEQYLQDSGVGNLLDMAGEAGRWSLLHVAVLDFHLGPWYPVQALRTKGSPGHYIVHI